MDRPTLLFAHRLAGHLRCFVSDILDHMEPDEFQQWIAFTTFEPIGDERGDHQAATVAMACYSPWVKGGIDGNKLIPKYGESKAGKSKSARETLLESVRARGGVIITKDADGDHRQPESETRPQ